MPVIFKAIKPKAFNNKAIVDSIKQRGETAKNLLLKDYQAGTRTWSHKVEFDAELIINPNGGVSITVDTDDEIYTFVHDGTKPHKIEPKTPGRRLRFQGTYTAKTVPGVIQSRSGGSSGEFQYRQSVQHPGSKGRFFTKPIFKKWRPFFEREMKRALAEGAKNTGHSI